MGRNTGGFGSTDFIGCGQVGNMGSSVRGPMSFMIWANLTADARTRNGAVFSFNHDSVALNAQSMWLHINCDYSGGTPTTAVGKTIINCGDALDIGFLYDGTITPANINDGNRHHLCWTFDGSDGSHPRAFYVDGVAQPITWTPRFTDNLTNGPLLNWTVGAGPTIGARQLTNATSRTDFCGAEWEDFRIYKRIVTPAEVQEIARAPGWDSVSDYYFRLRLAGDTVVDGGTQSVITLNGGSWAANYKNNGTRRRG